MPTTHQVESAPTTRRKEHRRINFTHPYAAIKFDAQLLRWREGRGVWRGREAGGEDFEVLGV